MANDYTVAIDNDISVQRLLEADFYFNTPFSVTLNNRKRFHAQKVLRIIPGRRMVAFGTWEGKPAVAKLFLNKHLAAQQAAKELAGISVLQNNKIPTPIVLYHGHVANHMEVIITEYIETAQSLQDIWSQSVKDYSCQSILYPCMVELATHHVLGVVQRDLHLKNFLVTDKTIYTIDAAAIVQEQQLLPKKASINNVALFLSQLGIGHEDLQEKLFKHYARSRGWLLKPDDIASVFSQIKKWNAIRWEKYSKKIFRNSTDFSVFKKNGFQGIYNRSYESTDFLQILQNPDAIFEDPRATILKNGRSSTVIKLNLDGHSLIIKRHNIKHMLHWLRRCIHATRALNVWRVTNKLNLFAIPVAKPVAFLEKRFMGIHSVSYYFSESLEGMTLGEYINLHRTDEGKIAEVALRVITLIKNMTKLKIVHGDLKQTNVLLTKGDEPVLIDYDGANEYASLIRLKQAWKRDVRRLLKNFNNEPVVASKFKEALT